MNYRKAFISSTIVLSCYAAAAFADAKADPLDVIRHTTPAVAINDADIIHVGDGKYCSKEITNTCQGLDLIGGEGPDRMGFESRVSRANPDPKPSKPDCDPKGT